ncbi:MAG: accessory factor UbiK family protein [Sulfuricaulis sp.]|uniref:accessory factor UbiK family protein n=1 Tax=Sulfuricaulis sp. TaxID=2003553 RepID=UPI0025F0E7B6|nr:accessory factor UbiK family protein [Sulfuricaulis sp.]MCR4345780.1 accessory factor UbiK family protein [Sulfuricaulis sp.]
MIDTKIIDQFVSAITRVLPEGPKGFEKNVRAAMQGVFDRMNLVSREELEVQEAVLARTRARLQELEKRITELEEKLKKK